MAMTLFRGLAEDVDDRLFRYVLPLERKCVTPEWFAAGTALARARNPIEAASQQLPTCITSKPRWVASSSKPECAASSGQTMANFAHPTQDDFDEGFSRVRGAASTNSQDTTESFRSIAPHAPYSTDIDDHGARRPLGQ